MGVDRYMAACLHDPEYGYYATRPALGAEGDFVTAPGVSQMFGELIGAWVAASWEALGAPKTFTLIEMGPGDGTLMADILRTLAKAPEVLAAANICLVETSPPLAARQRERLGHSIRWVERLADTPAGAPLLLVANELLDCLPPRQFVRTAVGWREQVVGLDDAGRLAFGLVETDAAGLPDAATDQVLERSFGQAALGAEIGARVARDGGCALLIDYGSDRPGFGDTLQALRRHEKVDPLACPGDADLTVHADFPTVAAAAESQGAQTALLTQADFLARLGIGARAEALVRANPDRAEALGRQLDRLVGANQMGSLFKVLAIHSAGWAPPGFEGRW